MPHTDASGPFEMRSLFLKPSPVCALAVLGVLVLGAGRINAQQQPNSNALYHQLRTLLPGSVTVPVENLVLKRDAAVFTLIHGEIIFYGEVNGKITGAVFTGSGHIHLTPPNIIERHSLEILTKKPEFDEDFSQAVLRFTDGSDLELRRGATASTLTHSSSSEREPVQAAMEFRTFQREHLFENIDLRLLEDVLNPAPVPAGGGFFLAALKGRVNPHILFEIDPHGALRVAPEEVRLSIWNQWGWSYPCAFHLAAEYANGTASGRQPNFALKVDNEELETSIEKNGFLGGQATIHLHAVVDGVAVAPLRLFPALRVSKVEGEHGEALDFIQEKKEEDSDFAVVLAHPLKQGESATVHITYGGKDAVINDGADNYDPVAREDWFPNGAAGLGSYATYKMRFHVPKEVELIATGNKISDTVDGQVRTSDWDTKLPLPVVGFHLGRFAEKDEKTPQGLAVAAYANTDLPDWAATVQRQGGPVGSMSTKSALPVEVSEGRAAAQIYEDYFGKLSFDHIALTQQPACNYGQSWPMLVYLPICGFWDSTVQHVLGLRPDDPYWKVVTAHEVAHQWWGHTVGFMSYRDQWMSEGFADASASIFLQSTRKSLTDYRDFWKQLKQQLTDRNSDGFRPIDVGPVTMGIRLSSPKTGWGVYQNLVYPKGAYILHMIRMMMWSPKTGDDDFRVMMHDFVDTYRLKVATTEDFKAIVEKHMTPAMDLDRNHRMDWFFNEYVYGTELPHYHFEGQATPQGDGVSLHLKLTQSGVSDTFKMIVPVVFEFNDGRIMRVGTINIQGNSTVEKNAQLPKLPGQIKHIVINYLHDVLAIEN